MLLSVELGSFSYIGRNNIVAHATIGKFTCLGPDVLVGLPRHPSRDFVSTHPAFYSTSKQAQVTFVDTMQFNEFEQVFIGHDVWIGARAIVMGGVTVGNGAIIGAGAVVTKNVAPYSVVGGVPARLLRYRFPPEQIRMLEELEWWNKDLDWIKKNAPHFCNISNFIEKCVH